MSNGISERQNKESNIAKLAAQRQLYSNTSSIEQMRVIFTVIIPLLFAVIQEVFIDLAWTKTVACIFSLSMVVLSIALKYASKSDKEKAAAIQQEFDIDVYKMPWDRKLFGERSDLTEDIATHSKRILKNKEKKEGLFDWYTVEIDSLPLYEGIAACQKENFTWDVGLRRRYRCFLSIVLAVLVMIPILVCLIKEALVADAVLLWTMMAPAITWCVEKIKHLSDDINHMQSFKRSIYSLDKKSMNSLQQIQKEIFESRKSVLKIPNWFYLVFHNNDEDREQRAVELRMMK